MAVQRPAVTLVQQVIHLQLQLDLTIERPTAAQSQQRITTQRLLIVQVVIAAADRLPTGAEAQAVELAVEVQAQGAACAAGQGVAGLAIPRVDDRHAEVALPAEQFLFQCRFKAIDPSRGHVLRA
ncbi:hypothetical protein D3C87_1156520 [compost metagenome]